MRESNGQFENAGHSANVSTPTKPKRTKAPKADKNGTCTKSASTEGFQLSSKERAANKLAKENAKRSRAEAKQKKKELGALNAAEAAEREENNAQIRRAESNTTHNFSGYLKCREGNPGMIYKLLSKYADYRIEHIPGAEELIVQLVEEADTARRTIWENELKTKHDQEQWLRTTQAAFASFHLPSSSVTNVEAAFGVEYTRQGDIWNVEFHYHRSWSSQTYHVPRPIITIVFKTHVLVIGHVLPYEARKGDSVCGEFLEICLQIRYDNKSTFEKGVTKNTKVSRLLIIKGGKWAPRDETRSNMSKFRWTHTGKTQIPTNVSVSSTPPNGAAGESM
jgi:hypothetical protein